MSLPARRRRELARAAVDRETAWAERLGEMFGLEEPQMTTTLLDPADDEPAIPLESEPAIALTPVDPPAPLSEPALVAPGLVEILPPDFPLPTLAKFVPALALRTAADEAARYALAVKVTGGEGLQRADLALHALRISLAAIQAHFEEPIAIAHQLHKRLTGIRTEWLEAGTAATKTVGSRIYAEQRRLEAIAAEARRQAQEEADRQAREAARREAAAAAKAQAPVAVVQELVRQAETVTAPPVIVPTLAPPPLRHSVAPTTWKARIAGTSGAEDPHPAIEALTPAQRAQVLALLTAILDGSAPLAAIALDWTYLDRRARADKSTLAIPGIEAYESGSVRAKGTR